MHTGTCIFCLNAQSASPFPRTGSWHRLPLLFFDVGVAIIVQSVAKYWCSEILDPIPEFPSGIENRLSNRLLTRLVV